MFRGREMVPPALGFEVMNKVKAQIESFVQIEKDMSQEGRNITMIVSAKAGGGKAK